MPFQSTVRFAPAFGNIGELGMDGPTRAIPGVVNTTTAANNVIGRAYTLNADGTFGAGGTGIFMGILSNPKVMASVGGVTGPLSPTLTVRNGDEAEFVNMGFLNITSTVAANVGDDVHFVQATGVLTTVAPGTAPAGGNTKIAGANVYQYPQATPGNPVRIRITQ